MTAASVTGQ